MLRFDGIFAIKSIIERSTNKHFTVMFIPGLMGKPCGFRVAFFELSFEANGILFIIDLAIEIRSSEIFVHDECAFAAVFEIIFLLFFCFILALAGRRLRGADLTWCVLDVFTGCRAPWNASCVFRDRRGRMSCTWIHFLIILSSLMIDNNNNIAIRIVFGSPPLSPLSGICNML